MSATFNNIIWLNDFERYQPVSGAVDMVEIFDFVRVIPFAHTRQSPFQKLAVCVVKNLF